MIECGFNMSNKLIRSWYWIFILFSIQRQYKWRRWNQEQHGQWHLNNKMHSTYESAEHDEQKFKRNESLQTDDNTDDSNVSSRTLYYNVLTASLTRCVLTNLTSTTGNSLKETNSLFQWLMIILTVATSTQDPDVLMHFIIWYLWGVNICSYSVSFLLWGATKFCNCFLHCCLHLPWWRFHNQREVINLQRLWDLFCWLFDLHLIW